MRSLRVVASRVRALIRGRRLDDDLQDEIASHLDEATEEFVQQGLSPAEARRAARRSFGGVAQAIELHRDARGWTWLESMLRDARRAIRLLRRSPAVTAAAVLSLALGIGGTTTMFSLLNGLVLRPLPVPSPEHLAVIMSGDEIHNWKLEVWEQLRDRTDLFDGVFAWDARGLETAERGESRPVSALLVSGSTFEVLGLEPRLGRLLRRTDDMEGSVDGPVAVISDRFWRRHFGGSPDVVGRTLRLNGLALTIVGVTPASFLGLEVGAAFDVAVPMAIAPLLDPDSPRDMALRNLWLAIMARLKPDQDAADATAALRGAMPAVLDSAERAGLRLFDALEARMLAPGVVRAPAGPSSLRDQYDRPVVTINAIALVVLLIACINLANLFLARGEARRRELAIAIALGATRLRLVRQLVLEGLVLSAAGAAAGLAIAVWAAPLLTRELSQGARDIAIAVPIDWRLLGFTGLTAIVTALMFGVAPALRVTRLSPTSAMSGARDAARSVREGRAHGALVALQVGLSLGLIVSASLLVTTFVRLQRHDLGFDPDAVLNLSVSLKTGATQTDGETTRNRRILEAVAAMPEVDAAAFGNITMLTRGRMQITLARSDSAAAPLEREVFAIDVTPGWFETMGVPLQLGRGYTWSDEPRQTIVVNQTLARQFFGDQNPIGRRLSGQEVIGVVGDAVYQSARDGTPPTAYLRSRGVFGSLSVRSVTGDPERLSGLVVDTIVRTDPHVIVRVTPLGALARATVAAERVTAMLAGFFGLLALVLAAVGTYGVMAYGVSRRRPELAVRRALGATTADVTGLVLGRSLRPVAAGLLLGAIISVWVSGLMAPLLFDVESGDPATFAAAAGALAVVALAATWLPARRAAKVNPAILLRDG